MAFLLMQLCNAATAQSKRDVLMKYLDADLRFTRKANAAYEAVAVREQDHWLLIAVYPDSTPLLRIYFKDRAMTVKDGPFTVYYGTGMKALEGYYLENRREGVWKFWYPSGTLKDSGMLVNDLCSGGWKGWHENGQLRSEVEYLQEKQLDSSIIPNISAEPEQSVVAQGDLYGTLHGTYTTYSAMGQLLQKGWYDHGKKTGAWDFFYPDGNRECRGSFDTDLQDGRWEYFHENGHTSTKETYERGKLAALECYDTSGAFTGNMCSVLKPPVAVLEKYTDFNSYMLEQLQWPEALEGNAVNGIVQVEFTISREGCVKEVRILESPHPLISQEVVRFLHSIPEWSPAISHNRTVEFTQKLRIPFYR